MNNIDDVMLSHNDSIRTQNKILQWQLTQTKQMMKDIAELKALVKLSAEQIYCLKQRERK